MRTSSISSLQASTMPTATPPTRRFYLTLELRPSLPCLCCSYLPRITLIKQLACSRPKQLLAFWPEPRYVVSCCLILIHQSGVFVIVTISPLSYSHPTTVRSTYEPEVLADSLRRPRSCGHRDGPPDSLLVSKHRSGHCDHAHSRAKLLLVDNLHLDPIHVAKRLSEYEVSTREGSVERRAQITRRYCHAL